LFPDLEYQEESKILSPGDRLFLYTDGFTEASDRSNQEFGSESISDALTASRSLSATAFHKYACSEQRSLA